MTHIIYYTQHTIYYIHCTILYYTIHHCTLLHYAMLCYAIRCYTMLCDATRRYAMLCYANAILCYTLWYAMVWCAMLCYAMQVLCGWHLSSTCGRRVSALRLLHWKCLPVILSIWKVDCDTCDCELRERRPLGTKFRALTLVDFLKTR